MKTPLVLLNLLHQPLRTVVAILGVAFAILLIFMQLGFYGSAEASATVLFEALDFDLILISSNYITSSHPRSFSLTRLDQVLEHRDVDTASPLYVDWQSWRICGGPQKNQRRAILTLAFRTDETVFRTKSVFNREPAEECLRRLRTPDTVLMDTATRDYFGRPGIDTVTELNFKNIKVVGQFTIGTGLNADGMVLTSERTYAHLSGPQALKKPALGLIRLRCEAADRVEEVKMQLRQILYSDQRCEDVCILSRDEIEKKERKYWINRTSVGIIFKMGVGVALIVGFIFVYQVIATDIADHRAEYATLKAIGYSPGYLSGVVLRQALVLALLGYLPAFFAALGLYALGRDKAQILLSMNPMRAAGVLLLAIAMCSLSGLFALRKVRAADPADLF
ncbi:MAG: FtsX-like permease family protein [Gemmataceae bacterium]